MTRIVAAPARIAHIAALGLFWACGDGGTDPEPATVVTVTVTAPSTNLVSLSELVQLQATAKDASGNTVSGKSFTWSSSDVNIATVSSSGEVAAVANGSVTVTATTDGVSGTVTIVVDQVGTELEFTAEPTEVFTSTPITPAVQVAIQDALGSTVADATDEVTLALVTNNGGATLSGTTTVAAVGGVASFEDLNISQRGIGYALVATSGTLEATTSVGFDVILAPITEGTWYRPGVTNTWQWQLQGTVNTAYAVDVYDIDLFLASTTLITELQAAGKRVICYFSAGSFEDFRPDANLFQPGDLGNPLADFPDERWLDIRSANVLTIMEGRLDMAVQKGCDGVEPDNMDGYANNNGLNLTADDQIFFNRTIANASHQRQLSVGLKNDLDQIPDLLAYYDFQVNEQCHEFDECDVVAAFVAAGKPVFNAEYLDSYVTDAAVRAQVCQAALALNIRTLILPIDLDDSFRFSCDP